MEISKVEWYVDKRVIYIKRPTIVTIGNLKHTNDHTINLLDEGSVPVHVINDASDVILSPKSINYIRQSVPYLNHPNLGWLITVSSSSFITFMANIIPQLRGKSRGSVKVVSNLEAARAILRKHEPNLQWNNLDNT
jgi:hypothetical protein